MDSSEHINCSRGTTAWLNSGYLGTVLWNVGGTVVEDVIKNKDIKSIATDSIVTAITTSGGYVFGKYIITNSFNNKVNPTSIKYEMENIGMGISRPVTPKSWPSTIGNIGDSMFSEWISDKIEGIKDNEKK